MSTVLIYLQNFKIECVKCHCLYVVRHNSRKSTFDIVIIAGITAFLRFTFLRLMKDCTREHRFQISKKLGVKFIDLFLRTEMLQRNLNYFTVNLPLDFSEIFNIFRITLLFFFFQNQRKFSKKT